MALPNTFFVTFKTLWYQSWGRFIQVGNRLSLFLYKFSNIRQFFIRKPEYPKTNWRRDFKAKSEIEPWTIRLSRKLKNLLIIFCQELFSFLKILRLLRQRRLRNRCCFVNSYSMKIALRLWKRFIKLAVNAHSSNIQINALKRSLVFKALPLINLTRWKIPDSRVPRTTQKFPKS